jgi:NAD(P)-dependent dehydrogenase (short-subunit alcohol dehydrogenase family)
MNSSVDGTGVVVTGGASGLGRATAVLLAEAGRPVAIWDLNEKGAREAVEQCRAFGVKAVAHKVDVGDLTSVGHAARQSRSQLGLIGGIACCAGITRLGPIGTIDFAEWDLTLRINLNGVAYALESVVPFLKETGRGASAVLVSSTEAFRGNPTLASYTASKHAVVGLARSASQTLGPAGIRVNALCPGAMDTPMLEQALRDSEADVRRQMMASIPLGYIASPTEVGRVIRFLLSSDSSYVTGIALTVDGGATAG